MRINRSALLSWRHKVPLNFALVAAALLALLLLTAGCSGDGTDRSVLNLTVNEDGSSTVQMRSPGSPSDAVRTRLVAADWTCESGSTEWTASRVIKRNESTQGHVALILDSLTQSFSDSQGFAPSAETDPALSIKTTDLILMRHYSVELVLPTVDATPDECVSCQGQGYAECYDCGGTGSYDCTNCGGTGIVDCYDCGGTGVVACYWCDGTGVVEDWWDGTTETCEECGGSGEQVCSTCEGAKQLECDYCGGYGSYECNTCSGTGTLTCEDCGGTGEPSEEMLQWYKDAIDAAQVDVNMSLPGVMVRTNQPGNATSWELDGDGALDGVTLSASSWWFNWLYCAGALAVLALIAGLAVWLVLRSKRRAPEAGAPDSVNSDEPTAQVTCPNCGSVNREGSLFCASCGTKL